MNAANYMELKSLILSTCQHTADLLSGKTPAEIKAFLGVVVEEDAEEEIDEAIMAQVEKLTAESYARKRKIMKMKKNKQN